MIIVYIFGGLILLLLILAAFMPKTFNVEKTIIVNCPVAHVKSKVSDLNHYKVWNPWQQMDKTSTNLITGTPHTPGHRYAWKGKKIGEGQLTLRDADSKHLHFDLEFFKPWKSSAKDNWLFENWGTDETKITWQNSGGLPWPIARLMGPMISKNLNQQFAQGLVNLKGMCESGTTTAL
jgi:hypothetical protein